MKIVEICKNSKLPQTTTTAGGIRERMRAAFAHDRILHKEIEEEIKVLLLEHFEDEEKVAEELESIEEYYGKSLGKLQPEILELELERVKLLVDNECYMYCMQYRFYERLLGLYRSEKAKND